MKSGNLNFLDPSGPVQACNRTALTFLIGRNNKVHLRAGHEDPEGEQRYSSTLPLSSELDGLGGQRHAPAPLPPGKYPVPILQEAW